MVYRMEPWGRLDEAIAVLQAALEADPLSMDSRNEATRGSKRYVGN
jgi:hypothetical protein